MKNRPNRLNLFRIANLSFRSGLFFVLVLLPVLSVYTYTRTPVPAYAATSSETLNYQGRLLSSTGALVPDGYYNIQFNLYGVSSGGSANWTETLDYNGGSPDNRVRVVNGYFSAVLGNLDSLADESDVDWQNDVWLGLTVRGATQCAFAGCTPADSEMAPRTKLTSVPYALVSGNVKSANTTAASTNSATVTIQSGNTAGATSNTGNITLTTGNATSGNSGNVTLDVGTASGTAGTISIGTANASSITMGRVGILSTLQGNLRFSALNCTGNANGGALTADADGDVSCSDDDGGGGTLQAAYTADVDGSDAIIALTSADGGVLIRDNATPLASTLFAVQNSAGSTSYLSVDTSGIGVNGSIKLTGSGAFPGSPTEGQIYYRTDTDQLYVYTGSKWQADRTTATKIVAASNSQNAEKADYVADGVDDQDTINSAIAALPAGGGIVYLLEGTYIIDDGADNDDRGIEFDKSNVTIAGSGNGTIVQLKSSINANIDAFTNTDASTRTGQKIRDIVIDGNKAGQTSGTQNGIKVMYAGSSTVRGLEISNVTVKNFRNTGIEFPNGGNGQNHLIEDVRLIANSGDGLVSWAADTKIIGSYSQGNTGDGFNVEADRVSVTNSTAISNGGDGFDLTNCDNCLISSSISSTNTGAGIYSLFGDGSSYVGNVVKSNTSHGIRVRGADNLISSNTVDTNGGHGIYIDNSADNNVISSNRILSSGGAGSSSGIYIEAFADRAQIIANKITDTSGTGCAINFDATFPPTNPYLADNIYSGTGATTICNLPATAVLGGQIDSNADYVLQGSRTVIRQDTELLGFLNSGYGGIGQFGNLLTYSEQQDNAAWTKTNVTVTADNTTAPDNQATAELLNTTAVNGTVDQASATAVGATYTFSIWLKSNSTSNRNITLRIDGSTTGTGTAKTVSVPNVWTRYSVTQNTTTFTGNVKVVILGPATSDDVYAWGALLVSGSSSGVYVRSTSSVVASSLGVVASGGMFTGNVKVQPSTDSTSAFQIQNAAGTSNLFVADTTNNRIGIGTSAPGSRLEVRGASGSADSLLGLYGNNGTDGDELRVQVVRSGALTLNFEDATNVEDGAITLGLIGNDDPAIIFTGIGGDGKSHIAQLDDASGGLAFCANDSTTTCNTNQFTLAGNNGAALFKNSADSATAFQIQNAAGYQIFNTDTSLDSANLITNGSFEANTTGWVSKNGSGTSTLTQVTSQQYIGTGAMQVATTGADASNAGASWSRSFTNSTVYTFTLFAKLNTGSFATFQMGNSNDNSTDTSCLTAQTVLTTGWTRFSCTFTYTGTTGTSYVYFKQTNSTNQTYFIDGVKLESASSATPYREGAISLSGNISSPTTFRNTVDSTAAFQIQNTAGTANLFVADTLNGRINFGTVPAGTSTSKVTIAGSCAACLAIVPGSGLVTDTGFILFNNRATFGYDGTYQGVLFSDAAATKPIIFANGNSAGNPIERMRIDSTGNVGIGTGATVSALLHVSGAGGGAALLRVTDTTATSRDVLNIADGGAVTFRNQTNSTAALQIQNAAGVNFLQADTTNDVLYVGNATADATGQVLVLDTKNTTGDPAGIDGASYYNSFSGKFRCYQAAIWQDCIGTNQSNTFQQGGNSIGSTAILGTNDDFDLTFETSNATRLRINSGTHATSPGGVGIGTTATGGNMLRVAGSNASASVSQYLGYFGNTDTATIETQAVYNFALSVESIKTGSLDRIAAGNNSNNGAIFANVNIQGGTTQYATAYSSNVHPTGGTIGTVTEFLAGGVNGSVSPSGTVNSRRGLAIGDYGYAVTGDQYGIFIADLTSGTTNDFAIFTAGTTKSYFGGNIGIGDSTAASKLSVQGVNVAGTGSTAAANNLTVSAGTGQLNTSGTAGAGAAISLATGAGGSNTSTASGVSVTGGAGGAFTASSQNGGAATNSAVVPLAAATATGGNAGAISITSGVGGAASITNGTGTQTALGGNGGDISLQGGAGGTASGGDTNTNGRRGYIILQSSGGNVGIGTSTPNQELEVNGDIRLDFSGGTASTAGVCHTGADIDGTSSGTDRDLVPCDNSAGDIAEWYEVKGTAEAGDIVSVSSDLFSYQASQNNPYTGQVISESVTTSVNKLERSIAPYQSRVIGVVSTSPAQVYGADIKRQGSNPKPIALNGRVPVNISTESAPIQPGDYLTTSNDSGKAMKATAAGYIIGKALASWMPGQTSVMVFVEPGYYPGPDMSNFIQNNGAANLSSLIVNGSAELDTLNVSGPSVLASLKVTSDVAILGKLEVESIEVGDIKVYGHIVTAGDVPIAEVLGAAIGQTLAVAVSGNDTLGTIEFTTGSSPSTESVKITFKRTHGVPPKVLVSAANLKASYLQFYRGDTTTTYFTLNFSTPLEPNTTYRFDYLAAE